MRRVVFTLAVLFVLVHGSGFFRCSAGSYFDEDAGVCLSCGPGTFTSEAGAVACEFCAPGTFNGQPNATGCTECPANTFAAYSGMTNCSTCPTGYSSAVASSECEPCSDAAVIDGSFYAHEEAQVIIGCTVCSGDLEVFDEDWQDLWYSLIEYEMDLLQRTDRLGMVNIGLDLLTIADRQFLKPEEFAEPIDEWEGVCPLGSVGSVGTGSSGCVLCPIGTYSDERYGTECVDCSPGFFTPSVGAVECQRMDLPNSDNDANSSHEVGAAVEFGYSLPQVPAVAEPTLRPMLWTFGESSALPL